MRFVAVSVSTCNCTLRCSNGFSYEYVVIVFEYVQGSFTLAFWGLVISTLMQRDTNSIELICTYVYQHTKPQSFIPMFLSLWPACGRGTPGEGKTPPIAL